ncbi:MAG: pilus assembly protein N-terminal domain-containing protein [Pyrinomonadaceae bacterium]|nr:pilus assembly protein N-terminal domain-containing protein [Pyrinomonadaceae bacterium]
MFIKKKLTPQQKRLRKYSTRAFWVLLVLVLGTFSIWVTQKTLSAGSVTNSRPIFLSTKNLPTPVPPKAPTPAPTNVSIPSEQATRIKVTLGETREIPIVAGMTSAVAVSPEIAAAQIKNGNLLSVTGIKVGETIVLISDKQKRSTIMVQVVGKPLTTERKSSEPAQPLQTESDKTSGSFTSGYSVGINGNPSVLHQNVEVRRKLSNNRTLRISGEMFKSIGGDEINRSFSKVNQFGLNRIAVGIDSKDKTIDLLDSQVNLSSLSLNNYTMRGFHYVSAPKPSSNSNLLEQGVEIFAGLSRPSLAFYDDKQGSFAGAMVPVVKGKSWQVRAGMTYVSPEKNNKPEKGGTVLQVTGKFAPSEKFSADSELEYAENAFSWRARADLKISQINAFGEIIRLDKNTPFSRIGAQPDGNKAELLSFYWRPANRFGASVNYNHSEIGRTQKSGFIKFERTNFSANFNFKLNHNSNFILRFLEQKFESLLPGTSSKVQIESRSLSFAQNLRFREHWTNNFEARLNFSREADAKTELENGFSVREQLRFSFSRNSISGFLNYSHKTPTLTSLIIRDPQLLPSALQSAFTSDSARFLQLYQDKLAYLLPSVELPQTRNLDAGISLQTSLSKFDVTTEARFNKSEFFTQQNNNFVTSAGVGIRIDNSNYVQVNAWKSFGDNKQSALVFSYTHTFGGSGGKGFSLTRLLGFDKGKIEGRVYFDLNGNGKDDSDEPGVGGVTIKINEKRTIKTDIYGRYSFSEHEGNFKLEMVSPDLGVKLRATGTTQAQVILVSGMTQKVSFGVSDFGFISGQIFNNLSMIGKTSSANLPGIKGIKMKLKSNDPNMANFSTESYTAANGVYEFRNLRPGEYTLELDTATLPPNFKTPSQTVWSVRVNPLLGFYFDVLLEAQRSVIGVVYIDRNNNGKFDFQIDQPVPSAIITAENQTAVSGENGSYLLRNLPAGKLRLFARSQNNSESSPVLIEFGAEPATKRDINLAVSQ